MLIPVMLAAAAIAANHSDELDRIRSVYRGSWHATFHETQSRFSTGSVRRLTITNACHRRKKELICKQSVNGAAAAIIRYSEGRKPGEVITLTSKPDGKNWAAGKLRMTGASWSFPWTERHGASRILFKVENTILSFDRIRFAKLYSDDAGRSWHQIGSGNETRVRTGDKEWH